MLETPHTTRFGCSRGTTSSSNQRCTTGVCALGSATLCTHFAPNGGAIVFGTPPRAICDVPTSTASLRMPFACSRSMSATTASARPE